MTVVKNRTEIKGSRGEIVLYTTKDGRTTLDVRLERETIWLSQKQMSVLFDKDTDTIGLHIHNVFKEGELEESSTTEECSVVQDEGRRPVRRIVRFYNLDVIISVGYRVNSRQRAGCADSPDCREQARGEGHHLQGRCESNQPGEPLMPPAKIEGLRAHGSDSLRSTVYSLSILWDANNGEP